MLTVNLTTAVRRALAAHGLGADAPTTTDRDKGTVTVRLPGCLGRLAPDIRRTVLHSVPGCAIGTETTADRVIFYMCGGQAIR